MPVAELGIALAHGPEARPELARELHGDLAHEKIEFHAGGAGAAANHAGRAQGGMARERELLRHREDAHLHPVLALDGGLAGQDEGRLREIGLAGQTLELLLAQRAGIREHGHGVPLEGAVREDVDHRVREVAHPSAWPIHGRHTYDRGG
jgi:hypothetical protein